MEIASQHLVYVIHKDNIVIENLDRSLYYTTIAAVNRNLDFSIGKYISNGSVYDLYYTL